MNSCSPVRKLVIRGVIGAGLLIAAALAFKMNLALSVLLVGLSLIPLKGCPVCWLAEACEVIDKTHRNTQK